MQLKRSRSHHCGVSNIDYKCVNQSKPPRPLPSDPNFLKTLTFGKPKNFQELLKEKMQRTAPQPLLKTKSFYQSSGKEIKQQAQLCEGERKNILEKLGKSVWNGDSNLEYDERLLGEYEYKKERAEEGSGQVRKRSSVKDNEALSSQLVSFGKYNSESVKEKINFEKVREIRRTIRRRYSSRKNLQKLFNAWDKETKGFISVENAHEMINKLGINCNMNEAQVLIASVDQNYSGSLSLDEFMDLIFNANDALDINLEKIKDLTSIEGYDQAQVIQILQKDAYNVRQSQRKSQLRLVLKNKLWQLANYCLQDDPQNSGKLSVEQLNRALNNLGVNENILTQEDKDYFIGQYRVEGEESKVNYGQFIKDLKEFQYNPDEIYKQGLVDSKTRFTSEQIHSQLEVYDKYSSDRYNWKSLQAQPVNKLLTILNSAQTARRKMINKKITQQGLYEYLKGVSGVEEKDKFDKDHAISYEQLTKAFKEFFQTKDIQLDQQYFDGLMAYFVYNQYGFTKTSQIPNILFTESQKEYFYRVSDQYQHGPPPPIESRDYKNQQNCPQSQSQSLDNINLQKVLGKIETRVFDRKVEQFKLFKEFDIDGDGYVSLKDAKQKLKQLNILNEPEISKFIQYMDKDKKAYLTFDEFSQIIKPNMGNLDQNGNLIELPNSQPSKAIHDRNVQKSSEVFQFIQKERAYFRAESSEGKTRFGKTPAWKNTFLNFQAPSNSGQYITENQRLKVNSQSKVQYQIDERNLKQQREMSKLIKCKEIKEFQATQIETEQKLMELKRMNKYKAKGLAQWAYEHKCHLQNQIL